MSAAGRAVLLERQLLSARLPLERIIVVARLFADEKHGFRFLLTFGHGGNYLFENVRGWQTIHCTLFGGEGEREGNLARCDGQPTLREFQN